MPKFGSTGRQCTWVSGGTEVHIVDIFEIVTSTRLGNSSNASSVWGQIPSCTMQNDKHVRAIMFFNSVVVELSYYTASGETLGCTLRLALANLTFRGFERFIDFKFLQAFALNTQKLRKSKISETNPLVKFFYIKLLKKQVGF